MHFSIITTAALPWLTGPAINAVERAAGLARRGHRVDLYIPWITRECDRRAFYGPDHVFDTVDDQVAWITKTALPGSCAALVAIKSYPAKAREGAAGRYLEPNYVLKPLDLTPSDVVILEEVDRLAVFPLKSIAAHQISIGLRSTNYHHYIGTEDIRDVFRAAGARTFLYLSETLPRRLVTRVFTLSEGHRFGATERFLPLVGVRDVFFSGGEVGEKSGAYFAGALSPAKNVDDLLSVAAHPDVGRIDVYGEGGARDRLEREARRRGVSLVFHGARARLWADAARHKVFVNPSVSELYSTTTAEALAMGNAVVVPDHICYAPFKRFANCHCYADIGDLPGLVARVLAEPLRPPGPVEDLSWDSVTSVLLGQVSAIAARERLRPMALARLLRRRVQRFRTGP